jgi:hypothetical protein
MPYHILMVVPSSFFGDYGCHVRILEETRVLQKRGYRVTIVTYYKGRDLPELNIVRTRPTPWHADYEVGSSRHKIAFDVLLSWTSPARRCASPTSSTRICTRAPDRIARARSAVRRWCSISREA